MPARTRYVAKLIKVDHFLRSWFDAARDYKTLSNLNKAEVGGIRRSSYLGSKTCLTFEKGRSCPQPSTQRLTFVPCMKNSKWPVAIGVLRTPLATSLKVRPGQELCSCLDVLSYHTPAEMATQGTLGSLPKAKKQPKTARAHRIVTVPKRATWWH